MYPARFRPSVTIYARWDTHISDATISDQTRSFSHARTTIPPCNWTDAAHRNGVKMLGTFLIEHLEQTPELEYLVMGPLMSKQEVSDPGTEARWSPYFADKLVDLAVHYRFDGYLLNIESPFAPPSAHQRYMAASLQLWMRHLVSEMHRRLPGSQVIWYDSMTTEGIISWQNKLNNLNLPFFLDADAIYLNYFWQAPDPQESTELAGNRNRDVLVGTDVWGRGTFGGGGFDCWKALKVIQAARASAVLFAPAWTYEYYGAADFARNERLFWLGGQTSEYPPPQTDDAISKIVQIQRNVFSVLDGTQWVEDKTVVWLVFVVVYIDVGAESAIGGKRHLAIADFVSARPAPGTQWVWSSFDRGFGDKFFVGGKLILSQPWSHLSHQSIPPYLSEPIAYHPPAPDAAPHPLLTCTLSGDDAYIGGTSLVVRISPDTQTASATTWERAMIPLLESALPVATEGNVLKLVFKPGQAGDKVKIGVYANVGWTAAGEKNHDVGEETAKLWREGVTGGAGSKESSSFAFVDPPEADVGAPLVVPMVEVDKGHGVGTDGWITSYVQLQVPVPATVNKLVIREIGVIVSGVTLTPTTLTDLAFIGGIGILPSPSFASITHPVIDSYQIAAIRFISKSVDRDAKTQSLRLWATLTWDPQQPASSTTETTAIDFYCIHYRLSRPSSHDGIPPSYRAEEPPEEHRAGEGGLIFLGTAFDTKFRISGLDISTGVGTGSAEGAIEVVIEGVSVVGEVVSMKAVVLEI
ncbi:glycosyl hydrolase family 85-domain-containing protein [Jimgerdemannia flammicorona]|uniref:Glycosyl hydrolase family 85-domain-containing protein n=1 Tax=Jimgerdemannia flammicorona TaxID=994334 RepID=A0A433D856_9FUNG|nr:glycosyl hydrolase family 85-domain-containing protein [Jimgerdemannia flammicorona]